MRRSHLLGTVALLAILVCAPVALAQTTNWIGGNGDWSNPINWSAGVPNAATDAIVNNGGTPAITTSAQAQDVRVLWGNLRVQGGALTCDLIYMTGGAVLDQQGGNIQVNGPVDIAPGSYSGQAGQFDILSSIDIDGPTVLDGTQVAVAGDFEADTLDLTNGATLSAGGGVFVLGALVSTNSTINAGASFFFGTCDVQGSTLFSAGDLQTGFLDGDGSSISAWSFTIGGDCLLSGATQVVVNGSTFQSSNLSLTGGSRVDASGDLQVSGLLIATGSEVNAAGSATLGSCNLSNSLVTSIGNLSSGDLDGDVSLVTAFDLIVSGDLGFQGGAITTGQDLIVGGTLNVTNTDVQVGRHLTAYEAWTTSGSLVVGGGAAVDLRLVANGTNPFDVLGNLTSNDELVFLTLPNGVIHGACSSAGHYTQNQGNVNVGGALVVGANVSASGGWMNAQSVSVAGLSTLAGFAHWALTADAHFTDLDMFVGSTLAVLGGDLTVDASVQWNDATVSVASDCVILGPADLTNSDLAVAGTLEFHGNATQFGGTTAAVQGAFVGSFEITQGALAVDYLQNYGSLIFAGTTSSLSATQLVLQPGSSLRPTVDNLGLSPIMTDTATLGGDLIVTDSFAALGIYDLITATTAVSGTFASMSMPGPEWWTHYSTSAFSLEKGVPDVVEPIVSGNCLSVENVCETVPFVFSRTDPNEARAVSVTFEISPELALCVDPATSIRQGSWLSGFGTAFQVVDEGGGIYTVDQSILGTPCGVTGGGDLFEVDVAAAGGDGIGTITVTNVRVRDCLNAPLPGQPGDPADITIDTAPPVTVADLSTSQKKSGNDTDGITDITVNFSVPVDAAEVLIYRKGFGDYPEYDDGTGAVPTPPATPAAAITEGWALTPLTTTGQADDPAARDFWYYVVFTKDACENVSAVSNLSGGTLSYHLGDVTNGTTPGQGDNQVETLDISLLGAHYGITLAYGDPFNYLDVGPTTDYSVNAIPTTDDVVEFEDLVVFSMNYGEVSLRIATTVEFEGQPTLALVPGTDGDRMTASLVLRNHESGVKGLRARVGFDRSALELVECVPGELLQAAGATFLETLLDERGAFVDLAVLGQGAVLQGSGALARLTFSGSDGQLQLLSADVRGPNNERLGDRFLLDTGGTTGPGATTDLPTSLELVGARPNPFGRSTEIVFRLPETRPVAVTVHDVSGRLVRELESRTLPAGEHRIVWDGRTAGGSVAGAGIYFYTFEAGEHRETRKVVHIR